MSMIKQVFGNFQEEEFYREKAYLSAEREDEIRALWNWIYDTEEMLNVMKEEPVMGNKSYLYNDNTEQSNSQII